jgi:nucleoside-diphosphate-sugar epimerase
MKILITGSTGFFGKIIVKQNSTNEIIGLNRNVGDYKYDLRNSVPNFQENFDLVIHNAGKAHIETETDDDKFDFFNINLKGTINLLSALEDNIPKQLVFISSVAVYGKNYGLNINEQSLLGASDSYGLSKIQAEDAVLKWCAINNVVCTILRLPLLVGKNPPGNLATMLNAIKKGYYFNIGAGEAKKSMVLAEDVARFIPAIAKVGGIYNLTDGVHPSFADFSNAIAKKKTKNLPLFFSKILGFIGDMLGESAPINSLKIKKITSNLTFDDSRAREMGWVPQSVLEYLENNDL